MINEKVFFSISRRTGGDDSRIAIKIQTDVEVVITEMSLENYALLISGQSHVEAIVVTERKNKLAEESNA